MPPKMRWDPDEDNIEQSKYVLLNRNTTLITIKKVDIHEYIVKLPDIQFDLQTKWLLA